MTISPDLFLAILAMDSYNRGYNEGIVVSGSQIGTATIGAASPTGLNSPERAASFFAQAYTLQSGQRVISYRGTTFDGDLGPSFAEAVAA
jgi:hypothetical protein